MGRCKVYKIADPGQLYKYIVLYAYRESRIYVFMFIGSCAAVNVCCVTSHAKRSVMALNYNQVCCLIKGWVQSVLLLLNRALLLCAVYITIASYTIRLRLWREGNIVLYYWNRFIYATSNNVYFVCIYTQHIHACIV